MAASAHARKDGPASSALPARIGNYRPLLRLASGGMATVYVAKHTGPAGFDRFVVIKRVHPHLLVDADFAKLFQAEVRISASISHPNVVPVFDVVDEGGELSMVLDYVEAVSLKELIKAHRARGERLPPAIVARIVADVLAGLHAAHEARDVEGKPLSIVHRDISPDNIVVGLDGSARLLDFGIAKAASRVFSTATGVLRGKLRYMSPEQLRGRALDRRSDLFSVGTTLYEALAGESPFDADDEGVIAMRVMTPEVPPLAAALGASAALDAVLSKAFERDVESRYATAIEMQDALERALPPAPTRAVAEIVDRLFGERLRERRARLYEEAKASPPDDAAESPTRRDDRPARGRRALIAFVAAASVAGIAAGLSRAVTTTKAANAEVAAPVSEARPSASEASNATASPSANVNAESSAAPAASSSPARAASAPPRPALRRAASPTPRPGDSPAVRAAPAERK